MDPLTTSSAPTIHPDNERKETPQIEYSEAAKNYLNFRRRRMISARDTRDTVRQEFDDMPFLKWWDVMKRADDQYVAPRKNKTDTSINTGTIRDKDTTLVEYAMKYDFEPVAQVYDDEDDMLVEVAETGEDLVRKSKHMEDYKAKLKLIVRSFVTFGTALVEDQWVERWVVEKTLKNGFKAGLGSDKAEWQQKLVKQYDGCQAKLWDLRKCYFGDIRKYFVNGPQGQPFFFTVEYESYDVVKSIFGNWDRFKYVPTLITMTPDIQSAQVYNASWALRPISENYVEIIRYYDPVANEFAITLNGIDMLPIMESKTTVNGIEKTLISGFPLTEVSPSGAIPFAKYDLEPMHDFVYSKGQPAKMRVWGDVENMFVKLMIRMMKQKTDPTLGNKSGKNFGSEVTDPGTIINDIRDGDLFPVLPNFKGADAADMSFHALIKQELSKNSVEDSLQGKDNSDPNKETATQNMNNLKAQTLQVAALFDGIIFGENQINWLRIYNIAKNWTKPIDVQIDVFNKAIVDKYRTVTVPTESDGGQKVTKKIVFTKDTPVRPKGKPNLEDSQALHQDEIDHQKKSGTEIRKVLLHPELFRAMKLNWYYTSIPVPNGSDPLSYMLFAKQIVDAQTFFGPDSLNVKKLKHKFASMTGQDFDTWFISEQELQQARQSAQMAAAQGGADGQVPGKPVAGGPTIAGAASGAVPGGGMAGVMR